MQPRLKAARLLESPDYIMEQSVFATVSEFLKAGGTPIEVVRSLSEHYVGYAELVNLAVSWSTKLGIDLRPTLEQKMKDIVTSLFDPKKADSIFTAEGVRAASLHGAITDNFSDAAASALD